MNPAAFCEALKAMRSEWMTIDQIRVEARSTPNTTKLWLAELIVQGIVHSKLGTKPEGLAERARDATGFNGISLDYGAFAAMCALAEFDEMAAFSESVFRRLSIDPDPIAADAIARWLSKQGAANS